MTSLGVEPMIDMARGLPAVQRQYSGSIAAVSMLAVSISRVQSSDSVSISREMFLIFVCCFGF